MVISIVCVLRSQPWDNKGKIVEYLPKNVRWLKSQIDRMVTRPHRFLCLSDLQVDEIEVIPLIHNWPGWWSKIELFRPGLFAGPVFYLDLDTVIVGNIDHMLKVKYFTVLKNLSGHKSIGSGLMAWRGDYSFIYEDFKMDPEGYMAEYSGGGRKWGDQGFIGSTLNKHRCQRNYFQVLFPGAVKSSKFDLHGGPPDEGTKIVCFHGLPKPFDLNEDWIPKDTPLA